MTQTQDKSIVKKLLVDTYGCELQHESSGFGAKTLNVAALPSNFSTRKTLEHSLLGLVDCGLLQVVVASLQVGRLNGTPLPQQVYNITGRVLHIKQLGPPPSIGRSQESKHDSGQAFCWRIKITFKMSAIEFDDSQLQLFVSLFISFHPFILTIFYV